MKLFTKLSPGLLGLTLAGLPMAAQDVMTYGGQVTASLPCGSLSSKDWLDGQLGGGAGLHALIGWEGGHALVPRFDYTYFKKTEDGVDRKVQMFLLGVDYNYFLSKEVNNGFYVGGGLGVGTTKFELTGQGFSKNDWPTRAYGAASAGYMFNHRIGAELRYTYARYKPDVTGFTPRGYTGKPTVDSPTLNASVIFRL